MHQASLYIAQTSKAGGKCAETRNACCLWRQAHRVLEYNKGPFGEFKAQHAMPG